MRFHHYAMEVGNLEETIAFYKNYCNFLEENRMSFMEEECVFLVSENFRLELISGIEKNDKTTHLCFEVNNLREIMKRMDGKKRLEGPYNLPNGWETVFYEGPNHEIIEFLKTL